MSGLPNVAPFVDAVLPSSASTVILAVYNAQSDKIAAANRANLAARAQQAARAKDLAKASPLVAPSTITLTLSGTSTPAQPAVVRPTSPGSAGNAPQATAQAPTTGPIASVVFDISPAGGVGFVQTISDHAEAHQSIHQTAGGFYVDDFGLKPGEVSIEAIVVFTSAIAAHVQVFKDLLYKAKRIIGPTITPPPSLLYTNSIDGRTLVLTQTSLDISQSATNPNTATVSIRANILDDYATAVAAPTQAGVPTSVASDALNLSTSSGAGLIDNNTAVAGIAALA